MPEIDPPVQIIAELGSDIRHLLCSIPGATLGPLDHWPYCPTCLAPAYLLFKTNYVMKRTVDLEERSWAPVFNIVSLKYMQYPNIFHPYLLLVFKQMSIAGNCWLRLPQSNLLGQSQSSRTNPSIISAELLPCVVDNRLHLSYLRSLLSPK